MLAISELATVEGTPIADTEIPSDGSTVGDAPAAGPSSSTSPPVSGMTREESELAMPIVVSPVMLWLSTV